MSKKDAQIKNVVHEKTSTYVHVRILKIRVQCLRTMHKNKRICYSFSGATRLTMNNRIDLTQKRRTDIRLGGSYIPN